MTEHSLGAASAVNLARLEEQFKSFVTEQRGYNEEQRGRGARFSSRLAAVERNCAHLDDCVDNVKQDVAGVKKELAGTTHSVNQLTQALMIFHDPKRWFKQNWLGVVIVGGVAAIAFGVGTTAVNTGLAILAKAVL